jgi:hypothetical protein
MGGSPLKHPKVGSGGLPGQPRAAHGTVVGVTDTGRGAGAAAMQPMAPSVNTVAAITASRLMAPS